MFDFHFKRPGRLALGVAVAVGALTLAACGGSSNDGGATAPVAEAPIPASTLDSFTQIVKALILTTSETTEPSAITDVTATKPETTEPDPTV